MTQTKSKRSSWIAFVAVLAFLGLILWLVILLIKDPKGSVRKALQKKS